jgi:hypothetical protein
MKLREPLTDCIQFDGQPAKEQRELLARIDLHRDASRPTER